MGVPASVTQDLPVIPSAVPISTGTYAKICELDTGLLTTNGQFKLLSNKMLISVYPVRSVVGSS